MANLDTRSKRASSVGLLRISMLAPPLPDGTIAQADRQHIDVSYGGIAASGPGGSTFQACWARGANTFISGAKQ